MKKQDISAILRGNSYPGRGIVLGRSEDGASAVIAYFIMGRSANSRNRVFVTDGDGIRTQAFDESKMEDPSLIIYAPVRVLDGLTIVTNGDQTDTAYDGLASGLTFEQALRRRTFEPDGPNYTPRISGLVEVKDGTLHTQISILKSVDGDPAATDRYTFAYDPVLPGEGRFISTYVGDGNPLPSFEGEPVRVGIPNEIGAFTKLLWESLNNDNKVSLFVRFIDLATGKADTRIINKNQ